MFEGLWRIEKMLLLMTDHETRQMSCLVSLSRFVAARQLTKNVALQGDTTMGPEIKHKERAKVKDTNNAYTPSV